MAWVATGTAAVGVVGSLLGGSKKAPEAGPFSAPSGPVSMGDFNFGSRAGESAFVFKSWYLLVALGIVALGGVVWLGNRKK